MKHIEITGRSIKQDNGSGHSLAQAFPGRRFHDSTLYVVKYNGVNLDNSTVASIQRKRQSLIIESETLPYVAIVRRGEKYVVVITEGGGK
mgnify:FL=1